MDCSAGESLPRPAWPGGVKAQCAGGDLETSATVRWGGRCSQKEEEVLIKRLENQQINNNPAL